MRHKKLHGRTRSGIRLLWRSRTPVGVPIGIADASARRAVAYHCPNLSTDWALGVSAGLCPLYFKKNVLSWGALVFSEGENTVDFSIPITSPITMKKFFVLCSTIVALGFVAAGCGGGSDTTPSAAQPAVTNGDAGGGVETPGAVEEISVEGTE